ncbi:MAG: hypothetical protein NZ583_07880 [Desulfobacterota bacterium]|nr:hypothetical protein [Thermodesulfobacteriota bacterium]MDW8002096.1 hypothetical protein [Deltaproteobacteria bacterium]
MKNSEPDFPKNSNDEEKPIISPKELVCSFTRRNPFHLQLKKRAIITFDRGTIEFLKKKTKANLNRFWYPYRKIYEVPERDTVFTRSYPSGTNISILIEELAQFGVKEIIVFGFCGSIVDDFSIGDTIMAKCALGDGDFTSESFSENEHLIYSNWFMEWQEKTEKMRIIPACVWSTDELYRETKKKIRHFLMRGAYAVDMETYRFYKTCTELKLKGIAFLLVSDELKEDRWIFGFHSENFKKGIIRMLDFLLQECVL